jgi:glutathione S-transferase
VVITPQADQRGPIEMLKIWGRANSINVQKVLWCCGELGLQYDRIDAGNEFGVTKTPEYRALNPNALVPTIEDGDFQLWESNVIVRYLAQKSQDNRLCPADITTRFGAERWMDWQATVFWPALRPLFIELIRTPPANRDTSAIARGESLSLAAARILDARLSDRTFLAGGPFPWETFRPRRQFIAGMRSISIIPNCPTCSGGINS